MTTFLLIRHGVHELGGDRIAGRLPGVHLSAEGRAQAEQLVARLDGVPIDAVHASPMERTRETASPLARARALELELCEDLLEIDYGEWTGCHLDALGDDVRWRRWNSFRSGHRVPSGESMVEVQTRAAALVQRLSAQQPDGHIALVSHGDVIKALVAQYVGAPLDLFQRIEISPASVTVLVVEELGPWVVCVNHTDRLAELPIP
ncbi:MAG: Phosphoglycerate mutase [Ilumatobacteraceae bacterium]|nr:Phosphoglycerate mutase [Ilumatobacteraceae bacterium]